MNPPEGALVVDTESNKLGYVMGHVGPAVQLRPVTGGREWDADPAHVRRATDEERLSGRSGANARSELGQQRRHLLMSPDTSTMSAECALAQRPEYKDLHDECRRTKDVPLPHGGGILLVRCCSCPHHRCTPTG